MRYLENKTFDEIEPGQSASLHRKLTEKDIRLFAAVSGDVNPAHLDEEYAEGSMFGEVIAHGMWGGSLISAVLGTELPGPGTIYLGQDFKFKAPVKIGDELDAIVTVREKKEEKGIVIFDCAVRNQYGKDVIIGEAVVLAPKEKIRRKRPDLPAFREAGPNKYKPRQKALQPSQVNLPDDAAKRH